MLLSRLNKIEDTLKRVKKCCECADGGSGISCCYYEVTRAEAETLVNESKLIKGGLYKITDRGDLGIILTAATENKFNEQGVRLMLIPNGSRSADGILDEISDYWDHSASYNIGDKVIFCGHVWENTTGSNYDIYSYPSDFEANWSLVSKSNFTNNEYREKHFIINYDYDNDWISKQIDEHGNTFGVSYKGYANFQHESELNIIGNPVDISDWNYGDIGVMYDNKCYGIIGNKFKNNFTPNDVNGIYSNFTYKPICFNYNINKISSNYITDNLGNGISSNKSNDYVDIYNNIVDGDIYNNSSKNNYALNITFNRTCTIAFNSIANSIANNDCIIIYGNNNNGSIFNNSNNGSINANNNNGDINFNNNNGNIEGNSVKGNISYNSNNGNINYCSSGNTICHIVNNSNNGKIQGTYSADVFDTIVNK